MQRQQNKRVRPSSSFGGRQTAAREVVMTNNVIKHLNERNIPFQVVCKIGDEHQNYDWKTRSPLRHIGSRQSLKRSASFHGKGSSIIDIKSEQADAHTTASPAKEDAV